MTDPKTKIAEILDNYVQNGFEILDSKGNPEANKNETINAIITEVRAALREELESLTAQHDGTCRMETINPDQPDCNFRSVVLHRLASLTGTGEPTPPEA